MSSKIRLYLFIFCLLVFVIFTPLILLYANGYRFDRKEKTFIKTGSLFIDSYPQEAAVIINGEQQKAAKWLNPFSFFWKLFGSAKYGGETPTIINNLLPGKYEIEVVKDGFQKWRKEIVIKPGLTTRFEKIQLFFEKPDLEIIDEGEITFFWLSNSRKKVIYGIKTDKEREIVKLFENNKINVLINNQSLQNFAPVVEQSSLQGFANPEWSPDEKKLIFSAQNSSTKTEGHFLLNLASNQLTDLDKILPFLKQEEIKIKFDKKDPNYLLIGLGGRLIQFDLSSLARKIIFETKDELKDWLFNENYLEIIRQEKDTFFLEKFSLLDPGLLISSLKLPSEGFIFLENFSSTNLEFLSNSEILIFIAPNPLSATEEPMIFKFKGKKIIAGKNKLLYFNDYEIQVLRALENSKLIFPWQKDIVTRLSEYIDDVLLTDNWLYYLSQNKIIALEIDLENFKNQHLLFQAEKIKNFFSPSENLIYFDGVINNQAGLYSIKIK